MSGIILPTGSFGTLPGIQEVDTVANPAAGTEWTYTVPGGFYRRLMSATCQFVTSATVANRTVGGEYTDGANLLHRVLDGNNVVASTTIVVSYSNISVTQVVPGANGAVTVPISLYWLSPGYTFGSRTNSIQAADQYSKIVLFWECVSTGDIAAMMEKG